MVLSIAGPQCASSACIHITTIHRVVEGFITHGPFVMPVKPSTMATSVPLIWRKLRDERAITFDLKPMQLEIMQSLFNGRHTFGILPTGYGKSMCYGYLPAILNKV